MNKSSLIFSFYPLLYTVDVVKCSYNKGKETSIRDGKGEAPMLYYISNRKNFITTKFKFSHLDAAKDFLRENPECGLYILAVKFTGEIAGWYL